MEISPTKMKAENVLFGRFEKGLDIPSAPVEFGDVTGLHSKCFVRKPIEQQGHVI